MTRPKGRPHQREGVPEVGLLIREFRELRGLSLISLGEIADFSAPTIGSWERGDREIGLSQLLRIARALGVQPQDLLPAGPVADRAHLFAAAVWLRKANRPGMSGPGAKVCAGYALGHARAALAGRP